MMAAVPKVSIIDTVVASIDNKNCLSDFIPLPDLSVVGVCNLIFIDLNRNILDILQK